jgi:hypothetical protein
MPSYTDAETVEAYLGVTFTPEQETLCTAICDAVTAWIDNYTGRTWQTVSPAADEHAPVLPALPGWPGASSVVYLARRPVETVTAVGIRDPSPGSSTDALDAADYELIDPTNGVLRVAGFYYPIAGWVAVVSYTFADAAPPDITLAATMIASQQMAKIVAAQAAVMAMGSHPELFGLDQVAVGQNDVSIRLSKEGRTGGAGSSAGSSWASPGSAVADLLNPYRRVVVA